jgi:mRNA interferase RelE/StbE
VERVDAAILSLRDSPRPLGSKKLVGDTDGWRLRVGDYRILYEIEDTARVVTVGRILHRSDAY